MKLPFWCIAALALAAHTASAQPGNQSDVTGPSTTSSAIAGGAFAPSPGTVAVPLNPQVQAAITQASATAVAQLTAGTLTSPTGQPLSISAATQQAVVVLMTRWEAAGASVAAVVADLACAGATSAGVASLVESVAGLLTAPAPGQLASAIANFNALVGTVDVSCLTSPPPSFVAIQAVLANIAAAGRAAGGAPAGR